MAQPLNFEQLLARNSAKADVKIAYGSEPDQFGELWLPKGQGPFPVVVMIHGGCWQAALPGVELMAQAAQDLRQNGIAVWNIEYRRLGTKDAGYPGTFLDVAHATDYLRQIAKSYDLDLAHVVLMGHSAGGQLALWDAARQRIGKESVLYAENPLPVRVVISLAGINDLEVYHAQHPNACGGPHTIDQLLGPELYKDVSPPAMLPLGIPQVIVSGDLDPVVSADFARQYAAQAKKSGDIVKVLEFQDAGHFELIDPQSTAWPKIRAITQEYLKKP